MAEHLSCQPNHSSFFFFLSRRKSIKTAIYLKNIWEEINNDEEIIINIKTDSKTLERSIKSANGVLSRRLRIDISAIKEMIEEKKYHPLNG